MLEVGAKLRKNKLEILTLTILLVGAIVLRFVNLGYSNYTADEYGAMVWSKHTQNNFPTDLKEFFLTRKKGPTQYLVSHIPISITGDYNNELALRTPFAVFSALSIIVFYFLVKRLTKSKLTASISSFVLLTSGFICGFGRIAQYQNLNMFFSFAALYFYTGLLEEEKHQYRNSVLGTICWSLSFLSHWDAIFILPVVIFIFAKFLLNKTQNSKEKAKLILLNLVIGSVLLLPFAIPYYQKLAEVDKNQQYLTRRIRLEPRSKIKDYIHDIEFYNPFITIWLYGIGGLLGAILIKRNYLFVSWFAINFLFFEIFVRKPGTHIYNFLIPLIILVASFASYLIKNKHRVVSYLSVIAITLVLSFLFYQSYLIFVDHSTEYPWRQEEIFGYKTKKYTNETKTRYLIGFPHNRYWKQVNDYVNEQNKLNNENLTYVTNESHTISNYYMDVLFRPEGDFYAVGVKYPWSFANDYKFPQIRNKYTVHTIKNEYDTTVVRIYRVEGYKP